jgi:hypothetical protein
LSMAFIHTWRAVLGQMNQKQAVWLHSVSLNVVAPKRLTMI